MMKKPNPLSKKIFSHYDIETPNEIHQIDLLFLPNDSGYLYCFTLIDVASRYKAAHPLKTKLATEVFDALKYIYEHDDLLQIPKIIQSDKGSEFSKIKQYCKTKKIKYDDQIPSNHLPFVEAFNKQLAIQLFEKQQLREIKSGKPDKLWVKVLPSIVKTMNNTVTSLIKMKPIDAIKLDVIKQPENDLPLKQQALHYPVGTHVRRLLNSDEIYDFASETTKVERRRATDPYWSFEIYEVVGLQKNFGGPIQHIIKDLKTNEVYKYHPNYWKLSKTNL